MSTRARVLVACALWLLAGCKPVESDPPAGPTGVPYAGPVGPTSVELHAAKAVYDETWLLQYGLDADGRPTSIAVQHSKGNGTSSSYTRTFDNPDPSEPCAPAPPVLGLAYFDDLLLFGAFACPRSSNAPTTYHFDAGRLVGAETDLGAYGTHQVSVGYGAGAAGSLTMEDSFGHAAFQYEAAGGALSIDGQYVPADGAAVPVDYSGSATFGADGRRLHEEVTSTAYGMETYMVDYFYDGP